ncbi:hypothetical protein M951_chr2161 (nucleomorph) [Lotharella oceanica]|uniref:Uncharacterized protein n=1 Tax=Lotharella oceanica TaxID=641309 RepID=A0A060DH68_9EUKA|nr:hypothetical protein M951_chr2161 [Lotharella oceanica]
MQHYGRDDIVGDIPFIFLDFILKYTDEIKNIILKYNFKNNIGNFTIDKHILKKILYNIRTFKNIVKNHANLFEPKKLRYQLRFDVFSRNKTSTALSINNIHKIIMMQHNKEYALVNFFDVSGHVHYIKIIKLICYFLSSCAHHVMHSLYDLDIMHGLVYSDAFLNIMHKYIPEFLRTLHIKDLLILFTNLSPFILNKTLLVQIRVWSMVIFQEIQKKKYSFKPLLGYIISGSKLIMQALIEQPSFLHIIHETILSKNMKITYSAIRKMVERIIYPVKQHPDNIIHSQHQFTAMTHKTVHSWKHTRKAPGGSGKSSYRKYSKHLYHNTIKYYVPYVTIMLMDIMVSKIDAYVRHKYDKIIQYKK